MVKILGKRIGAGLLSILILVVCARIALPYAVIWYVNRTLNRIPGYRGSIEDINIALIRGAYTIQGARLVKIGGKSEYPLFSSQTSDLSVQWGALFEGKFVGEIALEHGVINFVNGRSHKDEQLAVDSEWLQVVKDLFPLRLNRFQLSDFSIHYRDPYASPPVDVVLDRVRVDGRNFSNTRHPTDTLEATVFAVAMAEKTAPLKARAEINPSRSRPTFKLEGELDNLPLTKLNDLFRAYAGFDAEAGSLDVYLAMQANDGNIKGLIKPLAHDVQTFSLSEDNDSILSEMWQALVGAAAGIFENHRKDQIGTIIPFELEDDKVTSDKWTAIVETIRNAFFKALKPGLSAKERKEQ